MTKSIVFKLVLALFAVLLHIYAKDSTAVENQFSTGIYPVIGKILRNLFGWIPFSIGDIFYGLIIFWILARLFIALKAVIKKEITLSNLINSLGKGLVLVLVIYLVFNILWGLNYNRVGIGKQLSLDIAPYSKADLNLINNLLVEKVNASKQVLLKKNMAYPAKEQLFEKVIHAYGEATGEYPFLKYQAKSLKPSVWSWVGNYMGFTGYYNPFTGEAQVNTLVPQFLQPFTACHEIAHQLGYAKEMEANFVAYLAATASTDTLLHYSVYLDLFMYSNRNLFQMDSLAAISIRKKLLTEVNDDLLFWKNFNQQHRNPIEPVFSWFYGLYLINNQQPQGVLSYDEVTAFIIAYHKKYRKI